MNKQLITIICESALEKVMVRELDNMHVSGYTILDARGKGDKGSRSGDWSENSNIQLQIVCNEDLAEKIASNIQRLFFEDYAIILYRSPVTVLRSDKF